VFKSIVNGEAIEFETSIVNTDNYYVKNQINKKTEAEVITDDFNSNSPEFYYVYHFNAVFKPGLNSIVHTYRFNMSGGISENYSFDYILTAANRWANKQIDDFTLNIHMGEKQGFEVSNSFFKDKSEWIIENGRSINKENQSVRFIIHDGKISFKQKDFHPKGELFVKSIHGPIRDSYLSFDSSFHNLPNKIDLKNTSPHSTNEISFKILRNLPYAIRGYVFNNSSIQNYYLSQYWYKPNPRYEAKPERLNEEERNWMQIVKSKEWDRENN